ncbi:unnamed protein product [Paramecium sonneborni]|uniref:Uncharacterized protein n=1 Tax=Paramecium sonneborni TaxID=65129 RepID=A0A8S1QRC9_9CILI|nr:unnamed protein product [Paramecium sonneborni]
MYNVVPPANEPQGIAAEAERQDALVMITGTAVFVFVDLLQA